MYFSAMEVHDVATLFQGGFLEKATKRMEQEKALAKVVGDRHGKQPANKHRQSDRDPNNFHRFLEKGAPEKYSSRNQMCPRPYQRYYCSKPNKPHQERKDKNPGHHRL